MISLLLIQTSASICAKGCLRCSSNYQCLLCDFTNNYFLNNNQCLTIQDPNCQQIDLQGSCLVCKPNHFLLNNKCVEVIQDQLIKNCSLYSSLTTCSVCQPDHYLLQNSCQAIQTIIPNCELYLEEGKCLKCKDKFIIKGDRSRCLSSPQQPNCASYSTLKCNSCKNNFYFQNDQLQQKLEIFKITNSIDLIQDISTESSFYFFNQCNSVQPSNCKTLKNFYQCAECNEGFYMVNYQCIANPDHGIQRCLQYYEIDQCRKCMPGYFLQDSKTCSPVVKIPLCVEYSQTANRVICLKCEEKYFLSNENNCQKRFNVFSECSQYNPLVDECVACKDPQFVLNQKKTVCLLSILNCQEYQKDEFLGQVQCVRCKPLYYLNGQTCVEGRIANCYIYERVRNLCFECTNEYYRSNAGECIQRNPIENCSVYNTLSNRQCQQCLFQHDNFISRNYCKKVELLNCRIPEQENICRECDLNYNLNSQFKCEAIVSLNQPNCVLSKFSQCVKCSENFFLKNGKCYQIEPTFIENCADKFDSGQTTKEQIQCHNCKAGKIPYNLEGHFTCERKEIENFELVLPNCLSSMKTQYGKLICLECMENFYISPENTCVAACENSDKQMFFISEKLQVIGKQNCINQKNENCAMYSPFIEQTKGQATTQGCIECNANYFPIVNFSLIYPKELVVDNKHYLQTEAEGFDYFKQSAVQCSLQQTSPNPLCKFYQVVPALYHKCIRCKFGYSGVVESFHIDKCHLYDEEGCVKCQNDFYLTAATDGTLECKSKTNPYQNCKYFDEQKCLQCDSGYYLAANQLSCTQHTVQNAGNCLIYHYYQDKCQVCASGYIFDSTNTKCVAVITGCRVHLLNATCSQCLVNYVISGNGCAASNTCFVHESDNTTCKIYGNHSVVKKINQCSSESLNCANYSTLDNICSKCDDNYYLIENKCVINGTAPVGVTTITNCKIYAKTGANYYCQECLPNFHLEVNTTSQNICVADYSVFVTSAAKNNVATADNNTNCSIFDFSIHSCLHCKTGFYASDGDCCPSNEFRDETNECIAVDTSFNASKLSYYQDEKGVMEIMECKNTFSLRDNICCLATHFHNSDECKLLSLYNCSTWDYDSNSCLTCTASHYKVKGFQHCCPYGKYHKESLLCTAIPSAQNCNAFDSLLNDCQICNTSDENTLIFNDEYCFAKTLFPKNCKKINFDINNLAFCEQCNDGFFRGDSFQCCQSSAEIYDSATKLCTASTGNINFCHQYESATACKSCIADKYLGNSTNCCGPWTVFETSTCVAISDNLKSCDSYNYQTKICNMCKNYVTLNSYFANTATNQCCEEGKYHNGTICTAITLSNCIQSLNNTACIKCSPGHILEAGACLTVANCEKLYIDAGTAKCIQCSPNYVVLKTTGACVSILTLSQEKTLFHAKIVDTMDCPAGLTAPCYKADECSGFTYKNQLGNCIALGVYHDAYLKTLDIGCAIPYVNGSTLTSSVCTTCYLDKDQCLTHDNHSYEIWNLDFLSTSERVVFKYSNQPDDKNFLATYYLNNKKCSLLGFYYDGGSHISSDIENCFLKDTEDDNLCKYCKDDYWLQNGRKICCSLTKRYNPISQKCENSNGENYCLQKQDTSGLKFYFSNGHCCREYQFWDDEKSKCVPLFDSYCRQSTDNTTCNVCDDNYSLETLVNYAVERVHKQTPHSCIISKFHMVFQKCVQTQKSLSLFGTAMQNSQFTQRCLKMTSTGCEQCLAAYYKNNDGLCCENDEITFNYLGDKHCLDFNIVTQNCQQYSNEFSQCLDCLQNHHLSFGICCPINQIFNQQTKACTGLVTNCSQINPFSGSCLVCADTFYLNLGNCCPLSQYYDVVSKSCTALTTLNPDCKKVNDSLQCIECSDATYHISFGYCGLDEKYYKGNKLFEDIDVDFPTTDGITECLQFDFIDRCKKCPLTDKLTPEGYCCGAEQKWSSGQCVSNVIDSCDAQNNDGTCYQCNPVYYPSGNLCCKDGKYDLNGECVGNYWYDECDDFDQNGCKKCNSGYVVKHNGTKFVCVEQINNDPNCENYNANESCQFCAGVNYPNGTTAPLTNPTCTSATSVDNCATYSAANKCLKCNANYHLTYDGSQQTNGCQLNTTNNCFERNTQNQCSFCSDGYYLETNTNCVSISSLSNSIYLKFCSSAQKLVGEELVCLKCMEGFHILADTDAGKMGWKKCGNLTKTEVVKNCSIMNEAKSCTSCKQDYYLQTFQSKQICCSKENYFDSTIGCVSNQKKSYTCKKYDISSPGYLLCSLCYDGYYLSEGRCCLQNYFWNGSSCAQMTSVGLINCKQRQDVNTCANLNSSDLTLSCINSHYLTNGRCCPSGQYFDISFNNCMAISDNNCSQFSDNVCQKCSDSNQYISNGSCCTTGTFFNGKVCTSIVTDPNCNKHSNDLCTECSAGFTLGFNTKDNCCGQSQNVFFFDQEVGKCLSLNSTSCQTFDFQKKQCTACNGASVYNTGIACCSPGQYYNKDTQTCVQISALNADFSNCANLTTGNEKLIRCENCISNNIFHNNICCTATQIFIRSIKKCVEKSLFENCSKFEYDTHCLACKANHQLQFYEQSKQLCCPDSQFFLNGACTPNTIDQCLRQKNETTCFECNSTHWLDKINGSPDRCVIIGNKTPSDVGIANCTSYNVAKDKCLGCKTGFSVFNTTTHSMCCALNSFFDFTISPICLQFSTFVTNCNSFSIETKRCTQCKTGFYLSKNLCCPNNQTNVDGVCTTVATGCMAHDGTNCVTCNTGYYLTKNKTCCQDNYYFNEANSTCVISNDKCKTFDSSDPLKCKECLPASFMNTNGKCCQSNFYFDAVTTNTCIEYSGGKSAFSNCETIELDGSGSYMCSSCKASNILTLKNYCCPENNTVYDLNCQATQTLSQINCIQIDYLTFNCKICQSGYNLFQGKCIPNNQYFDGSSIQAITSPYTNCSSVDIETGKCLACSTNFMLTKQATCIAKIQNCKTMNDYKDAACLECDANYYLTFGGCCLNGSYFNLQNSTCVLITTLNITNCKKLDEYTCLECLDGYYLNNGICCQHGFYNLAGTCVATPGVENCKIFGDFLWECKQCNKGYYRVQLKDGLVKCLLTTEFPNCEKLIFKDITNTPEMTCIECEKNFKSVASNTDYNQDVAKNVTCNKIDIRRNFYRSTLNCQECSNNGTTYSLFGQCVNRTVTNCANTTSFLAYQEDTCNGCGDGFYLRSDGRCVSIAISRCFKLQTKDGTCMECNNVSRLHFSGENENLSRKHWNSICEPLLPEASPPKIYPGIIDTCSLDATCDISFQFINMPAYLDLMFSCHKCVTGIPFVSYKGGEVVTSFPTSLQRLKIGALNEPMNNEKQLKSFTCKQPLASSFNGMNMTNFPANCALGLINSDKAPSSAQANMQKANRGILSVFCVACQNGYSAQFNPDFPYQVIQCVQIAECKTLGNYINECAECNSGWVLEFSNGEINRQKCVQSTKSLNCISGEAIKCRICKKGYSLNAEFACEMIIKSVCDGDFVLNHNLQSLNIHQQLLLIPSGYGLGCTKCQEGYMRVLNITNNWTCEAAESLIQQYNASTGIIVGQFCQRYGVVNQNVACISCVEEYLLSIDNQCIQSNVPNCVEPIDIARCYKCSEDSIVVNFECQLKDIENCQVYANDPSLLAKVCLSCVDEYYIKDNTCVKGILENCQKYDAFQNCIQCQKGLGLLRMADNQLLCIRNKHQNDCTAFDINFLQNKEFFCNKCQDDKQIIIQETEIVSNCVQIPIILNCIEYDLGNVLIDYSYKCKKCSEKFFLRNNYCNERPSVIPYCHILDPFSVNCLQCLDGYYLSSQRDKCNQLNNFIEGCKNYESKDLCSKCSSNYYLKEGKCLPIPAENSIDYCLDYLDRYTCEKCVDNKVMYQNKCHEPEIQYCSSYNKPDECLKCIDEFGLSLENGQYVCKKLPFIQNCKKQETIYPFSCEVCQNHTFPALGVCAQANKIDGCIIYKNQDECEICSSDFILDQNKKCIFMNLNTSCDQIQMIEPFCAQCQQGFTLDENNQCTLNGTQGSCLIMSDDKVSCHVCNFGYYQDVLGKCLSNNSDKVIDFIKYISIWRLGFLSLILLLQL